MKSSILRLAVIILGFSAFCHAQGAAYSSWVENSQGQGLPGVSMTVCSANPGSTTPPCSANLATTYTDVTLGTPCTIAAVGTGQMSGAGCTNTGVAGVNGNYTVFVTAGTYYIQFYGGPIVTPYVLPVTIQGGTGAVASVFGRTGVVVSALNDYNFNQLAGTCTLAQGCTGLTSSGVVGNYLRSTGAVWASSAILSGDLPATIAANTSGTAANVTGVVATANGGTHLSSSGAAGKYLRSDATNWQSASLQFADMTGQLPLANTPLSTRGDLFTVNVTPALARLALAAQGSILHSTGTDPNWFVIGTPGQCLQVNGGGTDIIWGACTAAGAVGDSQLSTNVVFRDEQVAGRANENVTWGHTAAPASFTHIFNAGDNGLVTFSTPNAIGVNLLAPTMQWTIGASNGTNGGQGFTWVSGAAGATGTASGGFSFSPGACTANCSGGNFVFTGASGVGTGDGSSALFLPGAKGASGFTGGFMLQGSNVNNPPRLQIANNRATLGVVNGRLWASESDNSTTANAGHYIGSNVVNNCPYQGPSGQLTGNASDQVMYTCTLKASQMLAGKGIRIHATWLHSVATAAVTYKVTFGGTAALTLVSNDPATNFTSADLHIMNNVGATGAQIAWTDRIINNTTILQGPGNAGLAIDTTADVVINLTFNVAATDKVTPEEFLIELVN